MSHTPYFSDNERTEQQRRDVVSFAVGVSMSQNRPPSAQLVELQHQYIAGQIDLEQLSAALDAAYQPAPGPDPAAKYAPGEGPDVEPAPEYSPYLYFDESLAPLSLDPPRFLPQEATIAQRRTIMERGYAAGRAQGAIITPETEAVYVRYIDGEITLEQAKQEAMSVYQR